MGQQRLLDVDELPGAADDTAAPDADLQALQEAFRASDWWSRVPAEVEFPFDMVVDGLLLRGRCDAVFADDPDGIVDVVDWKTGGPPAGDEAEAAAVQLAVYRLAWHHLSGVPLRAHPCRFPLRRPQPHRAPGRPARPGRRRGPGPVGTGGVSRAAARRGWDAPANLPARAGPDRDTAAMRRAAPLVLVSVVAVAAAALPASGRARR